MPSPVHLTAHAEPHSAIHGVLLVYAAFTPGVRVADNATVRLDHDNELQPDVLLRIGDEAGGRSRVGEDDYLEGAPELIVEVAASRASIDMRAKRDVYRRNGVQEYVVWQTREKRIDWLALADGEYRPLPSDREGVVRSRAFPGLRLALRALLEGIRPARWRSWTRGFGRRSIANSLAGWPEIRDRRPAPPKAPERRPGGPAGISGRGRAGC